MKHIKAITLASLLIGSTFLLEGYRENRQLEKSHYTIKSDKLKKKNSTIKVAHLSDTQFPRLRVSMTMLLDTITNEQPDIIFFTGDTIDRTENMDTTQLTYFLKKLTRIAPTYIVSGNHETSHPDYNKWLQIIKSSRATLLENEIIEIMVKDEPIQIIGLSNGSAALPVKEANLLNPDLETMVLAHHPEKMEEYTKNLFPISSTVFSGHAHGGQIVLPGVGGILSPDQGFLPTYTDGLYSVNDSQLVVSRGLANSSFPTRINNYPHLIFTTFTNKKR